MDEITGFKTLVGTLYKKVNRASVYGKLDMKYLYVLNIVNELLFDCPTCYNENTRNKLKVLAIKLQHLDNEICIYREQRSLYTNIIGCKDCNPNNRPLKVINTKPVIIDPNPIEPPIQQLPVICDNTVIDYGAGVKLEYDSFVKCFIDPLEGEPKYVQITTQPKGGILLYNGEILNTMQPIELTPDILVVYVPVDFIQDSFEFQISSSLDDDLFSLPKTMTIIPR